MIPLTRALSQPEEGASEPSSVAPVVNGSDELGELRALLLGPEQSQLATLRARFDDPQRFAEELGSLLPDAVRARTAKDQQLTKALTPTVEAAISASVKKNPQPLVDAITPVIGPAIRKAIAQAFSELTQSINQAMERSFSREGLSWRVEAWRTGKPFSEVVLSHTLLYRVEQVFLIHRKTGLLLHHVVGGAGAVQDVDMVSSMLTAIRDFVQDSFGTRSEEVLDNFQVGELTVMVEQGPLALLAAVVRGAAPKDLRLVFQEAIEQIHVEHAQSLDAFAGDAAPFEKTRLYLEDCLRTQTGSPSGQQDAKKVAPLTMIGGVVGVLLLVWIGVSTWNRWRWEAYLAQLKAEPGIIVVSADAEDGKYVIRGLRDPLAADPIALLQATPIPPEQVVGQWEPYLSLAPS
ncbi:MAG: OmpA family protein, partial [Deltaproteobacteria bacterium]|nr:OmpA family protein [Deltaproteobacteria bacterium]